MLSFVEVRKIPEFGSSGIKPMLINTNEIVSIMPSDYDDEYRMKQNCTYMSFTDRTCCRVLDDFHALKELIQSMS